MRRRLSNFLALLCHRDNIQKVFNFLGACCSRWKRSELDGKRGGVLWKLYCFINLRGFFHPSFFGFSKSKRDTNSCGSNVVIGRDKRSSENHPSSHRLRSIIFRASIHVWFLIEYSNLFPTWIQLPKVNILKCFVIDSRLSSGALCRKRNKNCKSFRKRQTWVLRRFKSFGG